MSKRVIPISVGLMIKIADAFERAVHLSYDSLTREAYAALAEETVAHFAALTIRVEPWRAAGAPYQNSTEMIADTRAGHLYYLPTVAAYGPETSISGAFNPMLQTTRFLDPEGHPMLVNDLFRVVHDAHGHAEHGFSFGALGEFNAYLVQAQQHSALAKRALFTETLGQNAWVNFGPHLRRQDGTIPAKGEWGYVAPQDRPYAEQKITLLPVEILEAVDEYAATQTGN